MHRRASTLNALWTLAGLLVAVSGQAAITRIECAAGGSGRMWCEDDFIGACETGTAKMDIWVDESGYYELASVLYTNDSGDHQLNEAFYLRVRNSQNPDGYPTDPNCDSYKIILDGRQDQVGPLGVFYLAAGEANHLELVHYCLLYDQGLCTQYFDPGGEGGGGCANCESVGFNFGGLIDHTDKVDPPCWSETAITSEEICDGVDNDCDGEVDESGDDDGDGVDNCMDCAPTDSSIHAGAPERCDGVDNNCDGEVDEGVVNACGGCGELDEEPGTSCGSCGNWACDGADAVVCQQLEANACGGCFSAEGTPGASCGSCGEYVCSEQGQVVCYDPGLNACGACGVTARETCDGLDNDCDGQVDEAIGVEVCNCQDDDCDGETDEGALCDGGLCHGCRCVSPCTEESCVEPGTVCVEGLCMPQPCPDQPCAVGLRCEQSQCVGPCDGVDCPAGAACEQGRCVDPSCHSQGCAEGLVCRGADCVVDACAELSCEGNRFCRDGACVDSCAGVACEAEQRCSDGVCVVDLCDRVRCDGDSVCHAGHCVPDPCAEVDCPGALLCVAGICVGDPCAGIVCPGSQVCVRDGQCDRPGGTREDIVEQDCGCRGAAPAGPLGLTALGLVLGLALRRRQR